MFLITTEILDKAKTYMPLAEKIANAMEISQIVFTKPEEEENEKSHIEVALDTIGFRAVARESTIAKHIHLLYHFLRFYLGVEFDEEHPFDYDVYAESHILNQLERFKANAEYRDKVFDLLYDYKEFKKIVEAEIYNEKCERNDFLRRFNDELSANSDPKALLKLVDELKAQSKEYTEAVEKAGIVKKEG